MVIRVHCANYQFFMPDYQHNFFKPTPHSTSMPSSEVSQLKHAQGAIHICKPVFRCYEIGKYTKKIAKFFQKCKTCVSSFYEIMQDATWLQDARCGKVMMQGAKFRQAPARQILTGWSVLQSWESPLRQSETVQNAKCWIRTSEDAVWCAHSLGTLRDSKSKQKKIRWGQAGPSTQVEEPLFHQPRTSQSHCALVTQYTQSLKSREPWMLIKLAEWHNIGLRVNWLWTLRSLAVPLFIESYRHRWPIFLIIVIIHDLSFIYISYNYNIIYRVNKCKIDFIHLVFIN